MSPRQRRNFLHCMPWKLHHPLHVRSPSATPLCRMNAIHFLIISHLNTVSLPPPVSPKSSQLFRIILVFFTHFFKAWSDYFFLFDFIMLDEEHVLWKSQQHSLLHPPFTASVLSNAVSSMLFSNIIHVLPLIYISKLVSAYL